MFTVLEAMDINGLFSSEYVINLGMHLNQDMNFCHLLMVRHPCGQPWEHIPPYEPDCINDFGESKS